MNERGLVDVPENAVRDEPIAFGLTAVQLGICAIAVVVAAILNVLPIWEPIRLVLVGPICLAAYALPATQRITNAWLKVLLAILLVRFAWTIVFVLPFALIPAALSGRGPLRTES